MFSRTCRGWIAVLCVAGSAAARCAEVVVNPLEHGAPCDDEAIEAHVLEQFARYGPRSAHREYFGYIYRLDGIVRSAISEGWYCHDPRGCEIDTARAAAMIPAGAKVLGEWHTHPWSVRSRALSPEDVAGAGANQTIRCYSAFYSTFDGDIFRWDSRSRSLTAAMRSRTRIGNYRHAVAGSLAASGASVSGIRSTGRWVGGSGGARTHD